MSSVNNDYLKDINPQIEKIMSSITDARNVYQKTKNPLNRKDVKTVKATTFTVAQDGGDV
jgi:hypothetical protein